MPIHIWPARTNQGLIPPEWEFGPKRINRCFDEFDPKNEVDSVLGSFGEFHPVFLDALVNLTRKEKLEMLVFIFSPIKLPIRLRFEPHFGMKCVDIIAPSFPLQHLWSRRGAVRRLRSLEK